VLAQSAGGTDFWRWVPHPEVWLLVGGVTVLFVYAVRVIGPKAVPVGTPAVTAAQKRWFTLGILLLWAAADWPMHDIGEQYLYSVHMLQHTLLIFVIPPVLLLATPEWLARLVLGTGRVNHWVQKLARPVPAALIFNSLQLALHWQAIVNTSSSNGIFHYAVHTTIVVAAFLLWIPVCGPLPERRISPLSAMLYLFITSIVPTVPSGWLIFAEGAVYSVYDIPDRLWGISVTSDQQAAGAIMKLGAGLYLWVIIAAMFFRWSAAQQRLAVAERRERRARAADQRAEQPDAVDGELTWDQVEAAFREHPAPR
jgi:putative membrane protein